jgi:ATP-dependent Lhr-like helicase
LLKFFLVNEGKVFTRDQILDAVQRGVIEVSEVKTAAPSPFAAQAVWRLTSRAMYEDDTPIDAASRRTENGLLAELVHSSQMRPAIESEVIADLEAKLHRTAPGYAPRDGRDLIDWVKERLVLTAGEWEALLAAMVRDQEVARDQLLHEVSARVAWIHLPGSSPVVCALESVPRLTAALDAGDLSLTPLAGTAVPEPPAAAPVNDDEDRLVGVVGEWLQAYGPLSCERVAEQWGVSEERVRDLLDSLGDAVVVDRIRAGAEAVEVCNADNLESLLRLTRARARPTFEARPIDELPLFLACHQGLVRPGRGRGDLPAVIEQLLAYPAAAGSWETEILPARLPQYLPAWLDELLGDSDLEWVGCGHEKVTFSFPSDRELFGDAELNPRAVELFPGVAGRFSLLDLAQHSGTNTADLSRELWQLAWQGQASNDSFAAVRRGLLSGFEPAEMASSSGPGRPVSAAGARRNRWHATRPFVGNWYPLAPVTTAEDALETEERNKERVRLLLDRYGILFRELVARELPAFQWSKLFRALRLMELSGEILSGYFFTGISGPQFISHAGFRRLQAGLPNDAVFWMSAVDPVSPCGLGLELGELPRRVASNHLAYFGARLAFVSQRHGRDLTFHIGADHPDLLEALEVLEVMLTREVQPLQGIDIETINGLPAHDSPFAAALAARFDSIRGRRGLRLQRRY